MPMNNSSLADGCRYADRWLSYRLDHLGIPGVQAAVLVDDEIVLSTAHGHADVESERALTTDDRFRVASHSKTFTAAAILRLVEQERLRLDDRASRWVHELRGGALADVTVRELLNHVAGVVRDGSQPDFWALDRPFPERSELIDTANNDGAVLGRNEAFKYSNVGYSLLGLVIEAVVGQSYQAWLQSDIVDPLDLANTTPEQTSDRPPVVTGYSTPIGGGDVRRLPIDDITTGAMAAATGFVSNATDLVRWCAAHFPGDQRCLTDDSKRMMQHGGWPIGGMGSSTYGLGFNVEKVGQRAMIGHGGGFPGQLSRSFFDPTDRLAVAVLTNSADGAPLSLANGLVRILDLAAGATADAAAPDHDLERFEGRFGGIWGVSDLVALGGRLHLLDPRAPDPAISPTILDVVDDHTLRVAETVGFGSQGELMHLEWDDRGSGPQVVAISGGGGGVILLEDYRASLRDSDRIRLP